MVQRPSFTQCSKSGRNGRHLEQFIIDWDLRCPPHQAREKIPSLRIEKRHPLKNLGRYEFGAPWRWTNDLVVFDILVQIPKHVKTVWSLSLSISFSVFYLDNCIGEKLGQTRDWPTPLVGFLIMWVSNICEKTCFRFMNWAWTILFPCTHRIST